MAEVLVDEGYEVHLVTPFPVVSPVSDETLEGELLRRHLHDLGVHVHRDVTVKALDASGVSGHDKFDGPWTMPADATVVATSQVADESCIRN